MNFDFSEDQKFLGDQARKYLSEQCSTAEVRKVLNDDDMPCHKALWAGIAEMGWLGTSIPEQYGGLGLGMLELCVIAEELGRALAPVPFSSTVYLLAEALKLGGSEAQKQALLPQIADGKIIGAWASSEGPGAPDLSKLKTTFDGNKLSGKKIPVLDGDIATHALVVAAEDDSVSLVLVDLNQVGVKRTVLKTLDPTRSHAELEFHDVVGERIGEAGMAGPLIDKVMDRAAVLIAFEQIGGSDRAVEMATDYAKERYAFGRPIGGYQAIKHKLADGWVKNQVARSNAYYGAWALSTDAEELPEAAAAARVAACDAFWFSSKENIQTHGGMGFTWEVDCHLFYRRAKLLAVQVGSPKIWKLRLISALENKAAA